MLDELLEKQKQLMTVVPHAARPDVVVKMHAAIKIIDVLMRYLGSTGHKPWRPNPLSAEVQKDLLDELEDQVGVLRFAHQTKAGYDQNFVGMEEDTRKIISGLGIIEESVEYLNAALKEGDRKHSLEELTDILFFYLEQVALSGFTTDQIVQEYHRKWAVNIKRYEDGKKGDYSWDKRTKETL